MSLSKYITDVFNSTIGSINTIFPVPLNFDSPKVFKAPFSGNTVGVLIGITGDIRGKMIFDGEETIYSKIGEAMFGMPISKDMLESFAGELGNMIAGNMSTNISQDGYMIDITPPTVIIGYSKLYGFDKALCLTVQLENIGKLNIILMIEMK